VTDPTGTDAQHPALVTATGPHEPADPGADATGTDAQHPAVVTRLQIERVPPAPTEPKRIG
jgi:hypothetical protein